MQGLAMSTEELINFFSIDPESRPKDLLAFSYNPFEDK
jgi:hypothetical protein